jgi:imidazolonepropionase
MLAAVLHAAQLVTLAGPKRPRVGGEMRELGIIPDGAMLIQDGLVVKTGPSAEIETALSGDAK